MAMSSLRSPSPILLKLCARLSTQILANRAYKSEDCLDGKILAIVKL
jgi:hypothetical protein